MEDGQQQPGANAEGMRLRGRVIARTQQQNTTADTMPNNSRSPRRRSGSRSGSQSSGRSTGSHSSARSYDPAAQDSAETAEYVTAPLPAPADAAVAVAGAQIAVPTAGPEVRTAPAVDLNTLFRAISMPAQPSAPTASAPQHAQPLHPSPSDPIEISSETTRGGPPDGPRAYARHMGHNGYTLDVVQLMKFTSNTPKLRSPGANSAASFANYTQSLKQLALAFPLLLTPLDAAIQRASRLGQTSTDQFSSVAVGDLADRYLLTALALTTGPGLAKETVQRAEQSKTLSGILTYIQLRNLWVPDDAGTLLAETKALCYSLHLTPGSDVRPQVLAYVSRCQQLNTNYSIEIPAFIMAHSILKALPSPQYDPLIQRIYRMPLAEASNTETLIALISSHHSAVAATEHGRYPVRAVTHRPAAARPQNRPQQRPIPSPQRPTSNPNFGTRRGGDHPRGPNPGRGHGGRGGGIKRQQQSTQLRAQRESLRKSADEYSRDPPRPNRERLAAFWVQQAPAAATDDPTTGGAGGAHAPTGITRHSTFRVTLSHPDPMHYHPSVVAPRLRDAPPGPASPFKKHKVAMKSCHHSAARLRLTVPRRPTSGAIQAPQPQAPAHQAPPPQPLPQPQRRKDVPYLRNFALEYCPNPRLFNPN